jgi:fluoride exporter
VTPVVVAVALACGALAALVRYAVAVRSARAGFPLAVLIVNLAGSAIAGAAIGLADAGGASELRYVLLGGVAGGLTTFSTFSVETVQLVIDRRARAAVLSVVANLVGGLTAVITGWALMMLLLGGF